MSNSITYNDNAAYRFPVSVKGVLFIDEKVVLLRNERDEWELPGGKLELDETPEQCVVREIEEELGVVSSTAEILDNWVYYIREGVIVYIATFGCPTQSGAKVTHSPEHKAVGLFSVDEVEGLKMPDGYKRSIFNWARRLSLLD